MNLQELYLYIRNLLGEKYEDKIASRLGVTKGSGQIVIINEDRLFRIRIEEEEL